MRKLVAVGSDRAPCWRWPSRSCDAPTPPFRPGRCEVTGKIKFVGTKPAMPKIDMTEEPKVQGEVPGRAHGPRPWVVNANGTLAKRVRLRKVRVSTASYQAPAPAGPVTLDQDGCTLPIRTCSASRSGQPARDQNNFRPASCTTSRRRRKAKPPLQLSQPRRHDLEQDVRQTRGHWWRSSATCTVCDATRWLGVLPHPFFSVICGADGSFTLAGLPPGTYTSRRGTRRTARRRHRPRWRAARPRRRTSASLQVN